MNAFLVYGDAHPISELMFWGFIVLIIASAWIYWIVGLFQSPERCCQ